MNTYQSRGKLALLSIGKVDANTIYVGYAFLHEMFHIDYVSAPGGGIHVLDRSVKVKNSAGPDFWKPAYGPYWTKILARIQSRNPGVGYNVLTNGDKIFFTYLQLHLWLT
jgi:hypothetical protein